MTAPDTNILYLSSVARILGPDDEPVGAGFLIDDRRIVTCAHVVNAALRRDDLTTRPTELVRVLLPPTGMFGTGSTERQGTILVWQRAHGDEEQDVAGIVLEGEVPSHVPVPISTSKDLWNHEFRVLGFPRGSKAGKWASGRLLDSQFNGWIQVEGLREPGGRVEPGYSGAPVLDAVTHSVVGIVVAADQGAGGEEKIGYVIPCSSLAALWPGAFNSSPDAAASSFEVQLQSPAQGIAINSAGSRVATVGRNGVTLWSYPEGSQVWKMKTPIAQAAYAAGGAGIDDLPSPVRFSPDGSALAVGGAEGIFVCKAESGERLQELHFSPNDPPPVPRAIPGLDTEDADQLRTLSSLLLALAPVTDLAFSPDGTHIATAHLDDTARVWNLSSGTEVTRIAHGVSIGRSFAALKDLNQPASDYGVVAPVHAVAWSKDGALIATIAMGGLAVWQIPEGISIWRGTVDLDGFTEESAQLAFTDEDENLLVVARGQMGSVALGVNAQQGNQWFRKVTMPASAVALSIQPDGFVIADASGVLRIGNTANMELVVPSGKLGITQISLNAAANVLALATADGRLVCTSGV